METKRRFNSAEPIFKPLPRQMVTSIVVLGQRPFVKDGAQRHWVRHHAIYFGRNGVALKHNHLDILQLPKFGTMVRCWKAADGIHRAGTEKDKGLKSIKPVCQSLQRRQMASGDCFGVGSACPVITLALQMRFRSQQENSFFCQTGIRASRRIWRTYCWED